MKLSKFIISISLITFFCLLYVHQQSEIFRLGYMAQKKSAVLEELLDKNHLLRYNLNKTTSLVLIGNKISERVDLEMPENFHLVIFQPKETKGIMAFGAIKKENLFSRLFGIKREAQAKTINPFNP
ncbi:MAG: hypothetical protein NC928_04280 [Candidatus Omnitrophica bacterium]|nr:hypothetical protein [Candidatus Omnitrophota bacterium]